jgi:hypothetical protein
MTSASQPAFTESDAKELSTKLSQFGKSLPAAQQHALRALIERGRPNSNEVEGYQYYVNWWDQYGDYLYTDIYSNRGFYEGWESYAPAY